MQQTHDVINAHVEKHWPTIDKIKKRGPTKADVCSIYKAVRPVLEAVSGVILIPSKWRKTITVFIAAMDVQCP